MEIKKEFKEFSKAVTREDAEKENIKCVVSSNSIPTMEFKEFVLIGFNDTSTNSYSIATVTNVTTAQMKEAHEILTETLKKTPCSCPKCSGNTKDVCEICGSKELALPLGEKGEFVCPKCASSTSRIPRLLNLLLEGMMKK